MGMAIARIFRLCPHRVPPMIVAVLLANVNYEKHAGHETGAVLFLQYEGNLEKELDCIRAIHQRIGTISLRQAIADDKEADCTGTRIQVFLQSSGNESTRAHLLVLTKRMTDLRSDRSITKDDSISMKPAF